MEVHSGTPTVVRKSPRHKSHKLEEDLKEFPMKTTTTTTKKKVLIFEFTEDEEDKPLSFKSKPLNVYKRGRSSIDEEEEEMKSEDEEEVPISRLVKPPKSPKPKKKTVTKKAKSGESVMEMESDRERGLGFEAHGGGDRGDGDVDMVPGDVPISRLIKTKTKSQKPKPKSQKPKKAMTKKTKSGESVLEIESDGERGLGFEARGGGSSERGDGDADMVPGDGDLAGDDDDDVGLTPFSAFQTQETEDGEVLGTQERRVKPRAASSLPIVFGEKVNKTKVLLECEGDAVDLSGDMGAVGRFTVNRDRDVEISLDLKGIIYKTTIVPSNTFFVVNVGQTEAKVECIMSDFVQLRADTNCYENETMVEGTLKDFGFDSDEEREHLAINGGEKADTAIEKGKAEEGGDDGEKTKKKEKAAKTPKSGKVPAKKSVAGKSKGGRVASSKGVGKKHAAKATKPKTSKK